MPAQTSERLAGIERRREHTGFGIPVALLQFGSLDDEATQRNMDRFAADIPSGSAGPAPAPRRLPWISRLGGNDGPV